MYTYMYVQKKNNYWYILHSFLYKGHYFILFYLSRDKRMIYLIGT